MLKEFDFIRHAQKDEAGDGPKSLEDSGLNLKQQEKWKEAIDALELENPEIAYQALPKIERLAQEMYDSLPPNALLVFLATDTPRTKLTADFLSSEIVRLNQKNDKGIAVSFLWEPENNSQNDGLRDVFTGDIMGIMKRIHFEEGGAEIPGYFEGTGNVTFEGEEELVRKAINEELASENSAIRQRGEKLKEQYQRLSDKFKDENRPTFFYCVGHHSGLVALDVAFNGRERYDSLNEMPKPLSLWKANLKEE